jgi:DNA-binding CsgD family transcriptional regulator
MDAGLAVAAGDHAFARETVARAAIAAERNPGAASLDGIALQVRGLVDGDAGLLARAIERLEASPRTMLLASALADHGALLLARGDHGGAVAALRRAWSAYDAQGAAAPAAAVARTLQAAGVSAGSPAVPRRPDTGWAALTAAELGVAELISAGQTNRLAARALGISPNTVSTHLRSVFAKLDVRSRVQLANRWNSRG